MAHDLAPGPRRELARGFTRFGRRLLGRPRIRHNILIEPLVEVSGCEFVGQVRIGYRSYANNTLFRNVTVGRFCSIGRRCSIGAARHDLDALTSHPTGEAPGFANGPPTRIGNDVWIGDHAIIVAGLSVGDGAVIGAGAIVTRDVAPYMIVTGTPARPLRARFPADLAARLLASRWWRFGDAAITAARGIPLVDGIERIERATMPEMAEDFAPLREY